MRTTLGLGRYRRLVLRAVARGARKGTEFVGLRLKTSRGCKGRINYSVTATTVEGRRAHTNDNIIRAEKRRVPVYI